MSQLLAFLLLIVTLVIGYIVWMLIVWKNGTTPAKQLLKMKMVKVGSNETTGWWRTCLRQISKWVLLSIYVVGFFISFWLLFDKKKQELWDKIAGSIVVYDPQKLL